MDCIWHRDLLFDLVCDSYHHAELLKSWTTSSLSSHNDLVLVYHPERKLTERAGRLIPYSCVGFRVIAVSHGSLCDWDCLVRTQRQLRCVRKQLELARNHPWSSGKMCLWYDVIARHTNETQSVTLGHKEAEDEERNFLWVQFCWNNRFCSMARAHTRHSFLRLSPGGSLHPLLTRVQV